MANKTITQLTPVASVEASDEIEVQKAGETITKKATLTQITQVEATARSLQDNVIESSVGLDTSGWLSEFVNSWYLRDVDYATGIIDRGGYIPDLTRTIYNGLRILDYKINTIQALDNAISNATFKSPAGASGIFHTFGFYEAPSAHKAFTNAAATQTLGSANNAYGAYVFVVSKEIGTASGGTVGTAKITITGTSITDGGLRAAGDSEILVADVTLLTVNKYIQSLKKWIGQVTLTIAATGNHTVFTATCNYGLSAPHVFNGSDVVIDTFVVTGRAGANDSAFNIQFLRHDGIGWVYSAAAFVPGGTVICDMNVDYVTEKNLVNGIRFKYKRSALAQTILSASSKEGVVCRITTGANNAIESSDFRIYFSYL